MKLTVGTTPVRLDVEGSATPLLQNLGPGDVYFDFVPNVATTTGVRLSAGGTYEFSRDLNLGGGASLYLIATAAATDVRYLAVG